MRLVTAEDLRNHKAKLSKQGSTVSDTPDPGAIMDPWAEGRRTAHSFHSGMVKWTIATE